MSGKMVNKKSLQELKQMDEPSEQPTMREEPENGGSGGSMPSLPIPSLSKRQGAALAGVAIVLVVLYLYQRDMGDSAVNVDPGGDDPDARASRPAEAEIQLPADPDEITEYDAAVLGSNVFNVVGNEEED